MTCSTRGCIDGKILGLFETYDCPECCNRNPCAEILATEYLKLSQTYGHFFVGDGSYSFGPRIKVKLLSYTASVRQRGDGSDINVVEYVLKFENKPVLFVRTASWSCRNNFKRIGTNYILSSSHRVNSKFNWYNVNAEEIP